jgi:hypothetical protein
MLAFLKKRTVRWVLASILVFLVGGGVLLYWYSRGSLADFVDVDLRKLDDTHATALGKFLNGILPDQFPGTRTKLNQILSHTLPKEFQTEDADWEKMTGVEPWYIWRVKLGGGSRLMYFEGHSLFVIPSASGARIHFFDSKGKYEGTSEFLTGWRIQILDAALVNHEIPGSAVIEIKTAPSINGASIGRQFYAIFENRVALIRVEDEDGKPIANCYRYPNHQLGPSPPIRTMEEWAELLRFSERVHVLEALVWMGGDHFTVADRERGEIARESLESVRLVAAVRNSQIVQKRIAELTVSENQWIREAAVLAQQQLPKKGGR